MLTSECEAIHAEGTEWDTDSDVVAEYTVVVNDLGAPQTAEYYFDNGLLKPISEFMLRGFPQWPEDADADHYSNGQRCQRPVVALRCERHLP